MFIRVDLKVLEQGSRAINLPAKMSGLGEFAQSPKSNVRIVAVENIFRLPTML
jgi:hypothetical protein